MINKIPLLEVLKCLKMYAVFLLAVFTCLYLYSHFGPKYAYIKTDDRLYGAGVYRYNRFNGEFERCVTNKHRSQKEYTSYLAAHKKAGNNETIRCVKSYELTDKDISLIEGEEAIKYFLEIEKNKSVKKDQERQP